MGEKVLHLDILRVKEAEEDSLQAGLLGHAVRGGQGELGLDPVPAPGKTRPHLLLQVFVHVEATGS